MELRHSLKQLAEAHRLMETGRHAALIEEIGGMLSDPTLRQAYLESALPKAAG